MSGSRQPGAPRRLLRGRAAFRGLVAIALLVGVTARPVLAPVARADDPAWLQLINDIRTADGLQPVAVDDAWTAGILAHLRYVRLTPAEYRTGQFASVHYENPQSPYYTPDGAAAGQSSDLLEGGATSDVDAIKIWLAAPFHAIGMLRPGLTRVAFARDPTTGAAGLDVIRGLTPMLRAAPIEFPAPGTTIDLPVFGGGEFPDPLATCNYTAAGLPIVVLLPAAPVSGLTADLTGPDGATLVAPGNDLCLVTAANYVSGDPIYGPTGESILQNDHAVLVIPRHGLTSGTYTVRLQQPGQADVSWSFTSDPAQAQATLDAWRTACAGSGTRLLQISGMVVGDWGAVGGAERRVVATIGTMTLAGGTFTAENSSYGVNGTVTASQPLPAGTVTLGVTIEDPTTSGTITSTTMRLAGCASVPTALTINAGRSVSDGTSVRITGQLWRPSSGAPVAGATVGLYARPATAATWTLVRSARTNASGAVTFAQTPAGNTAYELRFDGGSTTAPSASAIRLVAVLPIVSATLSAGSVAAGQPATLEGTVTPAAPGATVKLQQYGATGWETIASSTLSLTSGYSFKLPTTKPGNFQFRVYRAADGTHGTATSPTQHLFVT